LIEQSPGVRNKWDSFWEHECTATLATVDKKIKTIDSYFSHAPRLNQNSVDSQAVSLEPSNYNTSLR